MFNKLAMLVEILDQIAEDDKWRMSTFINPDVFGRISDKERDEWYRKASKASTEHDKLYYMNRALGYYHIEAQNIARKTLSKETKRLAGEHDVFKGSDDSKESGFDLVPGKKEVSLARKEAVINLIKSVKDKFKDTDAQKVLSLNLVQHGLDEIIPSSSIPFYDEVAAVLKKAEKEKEGKTGKRGVKGFSLATDEPPEGLGISNYLYHKVMAYLKTQVLTLQHQESFMSGLSSLFGGSGNKVYKLSNLEPMIDVIKRDIEHGKFKSYGIHLQGVTTEEGEDMFKNLPNVQHQFHGDALVIPIEQRTNLQQLLKKAVPGKKVILFGFDDKPQPLRKGWEGFPYKLIKNPIVVGSYSMSPETKSESLLRSLSEGF